MRAKRLFDILFSAAFLAVVSPVMLLIAIIIKLVSPGPVFYKADRAGKDFTRFQMLKFRTMSVNQDPIKTITLREDPRIFSFGRILRKTKMDELPQLINVLKGDMSVVGPRPEDYLIAFRMFSGPYREILSVKPGITSPASLLDYMHGETVSSIDEYLDRFLDLRQSLNLRYVQNHHFLWDLSLIAQTAWTILQISLGRKRFRYPAEYQCGNQLER